MARPPISPRLSRNAPANRARLIGLAASLVAGSAGAEPVVYGGIDFPDGARAFADEVVSVTPSSSPGGVPTNPDYLDPQQALGPPDYRETDGALGLGAVSLGDGGAITLRFTDNALTGSGSPFADLFVFEIGPSVEDTFVEISRDGAIWLPVGKVSGATSSIDIDPALERAGLKPGTRFHFVRLTDDTDADEQVNGANGTVGADIDAVGVTGAKGF